MALQISKIDKVFTLSGRLGANQIFAIRDFFVYKLRDEDQLIISLAELDDLDLSAALMFKSLKGQAFRINKSLTVFTGKNRKILGPFRKLEDQRVLSAAA